MASNVVATVHSTDAQRAVKIMRRPDGSFAYREFRRDPEDAGGWTMVRDEGRSFASEQQAVAAARFEFAWLPGPTSQSP